MVTFAVIYLCFNSQHRPYSSKLLLRKSKSVIANSASGLRGTCSADISKLSAHSYNSVIQGSGIELAILLLITDTFYIPLFV